MKMYKLFSLAFATLAFAACSNDDTSAGGQTGEGAMIDAIKVSFQDTGASTRADQPDEDGIGTENAVYHAFVFAREASPGHAGARVGDWSVQEVKRDDAGKLEDGVTGDETQVNKSLKNAAVFKGVRQGDHIYVIANDPNLTFAMAQTLARNGEQSEDKIKAYISNVSKEYLEGLSYRSQTAAALAPTGKFVMAGMGTIPTNPSIANGSTVTVPVSLDRELAKVFFYASVTNDPAKEAAGKIQLKDGEDGFVVVRIPKQVSPFTQQSGEWYFPPIAVDADKDWDITGWLKVFDGKGEIAGGTAGDATNYFNKNEYLATGAVASTIKEYRLTYKMGAPVAAPQSYLVDGFMYSPYFYVTPNYANNAGCATVICTQATYTGNAALISKVTEEMIKDALADATFRGAAATAFDTKTVGTTTVYTLKADAWDTDANLTAFRTFLQTVGGKYENVIPAGTYADNASLIECKSGDKRFYRADVANYSADNTISGKVTERNTIYRMRGTITTLGSKTIEDAINSDNISMLVQVTVNKWRVKFSDLEM